MTEGVFEISNKQRITTESTDSIDAIIALIDSAISSTK
jgi:hypothetical protein